MERDEAVKLAQQLIRIPTYNPPGSEQACAAYLGALLAEAGFQVEYHEFSPGRTSVIARLAGYRSSGQGKPICFTGHLDTVPIGSAAWNDDPCGGQIKGGRLYGRGSSDMKAGIAAFVVAAIAQLDMLRNGPGIVLVLTASEETGCQGAFHLVKLGNVLGEAGAVVVAEPTANYPLIGHKGALWLKASATGVGAHGSMPEKGINAIYRGARLASKMEAFGFNIAGHATLGSPTINVGTFRGGSSVNIVPDRAEVEIDVRTVPGMSHGRVRDELLTYLAPDIAEIETTADLQHIWTDASDAWVQKVYKIVGRHLGVSPEPRGASFFTDACALKHAYPDAPVVILGPGEPHMAHQTNEYCRVDRIEQSVAIYTDILADWCGPEGSRTLTSLESVDG